MRRPSITTPIVDFRLFAALASIAAIAAACGGAESGSLTSAQTSKGTVLAGPSGKTLYVLLDAQGKSISCSGTCTAVWPPLTVTGTPSAGSGVSATLGTSSSAGTSMQVTANGNPVYYYSGDSGSGQVNGQGISSFGGIWYAVQTSGQPMSSTGSGGAGGGSSASATPGGGGY